MKQAIPFEDKAASWIDRLKGLDVQLSERIGCLERLLITLAQHFDASSVIDSPYPGPLEWQDDSFIP